VGNEFEVGFNLVIKVRRGSPDRHFTGSRVRQVPILVTECQPALKNDLLHLLVKKVGK